MIQLKKNDVDEENISNKQLTSDLNFCKFVEILRVFSSSFSLKWFINKFDELIDIIIVNDRFLNIKDVI